MKEETIPVVHSARTWVKGLGAGAKGLSLLHGKPAVVHPQAQKSKQQLQAHLMKEAETSQIISHWGNLTLLYRNPKIIECTICAGWVGGGGAPKECSTRLGVGKNTSPSGTVSPICRLQVPQKTPDATRHCCFYNWLLMSYMP